MMIFNTTYVVDEKIHAAWMQWMRNYYIKEIEETTPLSEPALFKVLSQEVEGESYCLQFSAPSILEMKEWENKHKERLEEMMREKFGESVLFFSTYLKQLL
ncbi:MAG: DUF4286 family protein [Paludibacteraceae bacterium]|nr:DUF4286 family protein [Paludibacteraceae bacterium]